MVVVVILAQPKPYFDIRGKLHTIVLEQVYEADFEPELHQRILLVDFSCNESLYGATNVVPSTLPSTLTTSTLASEKLRGALSMD